MSDSEGFELESGLNEFFDNDDMDCGHSSPSAPRFIPPESSPAPQPQHTSDHIASYPSADEASDIHPQDVESDSPEDTFQPSSSTKLFSDLPISRPLLKSISNLGWTSPTPVQQQTILPILQGKDVLASAVTGSGKTAAFLIPIIERLLRLGGRTYCLRVLIVTPTRELAVQIETVFRNFLESLRLEPGTSTPAVCSLIGGISLQKQAADLKNQPDVIIATPGRLIDHLENTPSFELGTIEVAVFDEADRLLSIGFKDEIDHLINCCPKSRQTLMFSATLGKEVRNLAKISLNDPLSISVDPNLSTAKYLVQEFIKVGTNWDEKITLVVYLLLHSSEFSKNTLIFAPRKSLCHKLTILLQTLGVKATEIHSDLTQTQRLQSLSDFATGNHDVMIATDVAARGLDINSVRNVINMELPRDHSTYVHRVGRTARAGEGGKSVSFFNSNDKAFIKMVKKHSGSLKERVVPQNKLEEAEKMIDDVRGDVIAKLKEERADAELRKAEMEAQKVENLIKYEEEIKSRPKRSFIKKRNTDDAGDSVGGKGKGKGGDAGKKRRSKGDDKLKKARKEVREEKKFKNQVKSAKRAVVKNNRKKKISQL
ncbi:hypothetical protein P9112_010673 [Eukaryota sp. TZLM1-RC]